MIESAEEFVRLRNSNELRDYLKAASDFAPKKVWLDVIARYPAMRNWVAHNKTIPLEILAILANDPDSMVRFWVAAKNKLSAELLETLAQDEVVRFGEEWLPTGMLPRGVLARLAEDSCVAVAEAARERLPVPRVVRSYC